MFRNAQYCWGLHFAHILFADFIGVPPLLSRRILETLTYLARNHQYVAKLLLHLELPRQVLCDLGTPDQGCGKAVVMEEDKPEEKKGNVSIVLLLSLLNQPLYMRSVAHLEQVGKKCFSSPAI